MSLGSTYNNNQNSNRSNVPEVTVYTNYRMNNANSKVDATCLTSRFWRGNLILSICPRKNTGNDEVSFDMDNGISVYLSHTKALILKNEIEKFLMDPANYNGCGVPSGSGAVTISNGAEYGKNSPFLTIRKIDENGNVVSSFAYEFKTDYHFSIRNYDGKNMDKNFDDYTNIEVQQLVTLLDEFCKAATNAIAYTVMDQRRYGASRVESKIDAIASSLGIETNKGGNNNRRYNSNSYFNNYQSGGSSTPSGNNVSYGSATIDDLE